ncbi:putative methyltransferase FkbM, methyltransferase type protein 11 [Tanacetum coccineum]
MDLQTHKRNLLQNAVVRFLLFSVVVLGLRFAYVVVIRGESCDSGDGFCFFNEKILAGGFSGDGGSSAVMTSSSPEFHKRVIFYINVFQDLIVDGILTTGSTALVLNFPASFPAGDDVYALKEIGVEKVEKSVIGKKIKSFGENYDFVFSGDFSGNVPAGFPEEVCRSLKMGGYLVVHTFGGNDGYSLNSFIHLFSCCKFVHSRRFESFDHTKKIHEIVMKKVNDGGNVKKKTDDGKCAVSGEKYNIVKKAEPLIMKEPLKPWIALKRNIENVKYLSSMVDISFKRRYVYVDVGSRSYGSSIVSWFKKQYPKQNKTFHVYAVEADKHFHDQYKGKKGVTLLPYAAWVKNESLVFEINQTPGDENVEKGRGMGRIQPVESGGGIVNSVDEIQGFDFAEWLKDTVTEQDFVVMKMDVEGTEFDLIPRLIETGAICLVDEVFLECHYNRWQKCCPGVRSPKYQKTYGQCMDLFKQLRQLGVLVHQWW